MTIDILQARDVLLTIRDQNVGELLDEFMDMIVAQLGRLDPDRDWLEDAEDDLIAACSGL